MATKFYQKSEIQFGDKARLRNDLTGRRYGKWVVIGLHKSGRRTFWFCECDCGKIKSVRSESLGRQSKSCGCEAKRLSSERAKHGRDGTPEHRCWINMRYRCTNPNAKNYHRYGGRGVQVCERWDSFRAFFSDMGPRPTENHSLDRIDNDGNYEPSNCRWADWETQENNRSDVNLIEIDGIKKSESQWCRHFGKPRSTIASRKARGIQGRKLFE